MRDYPIDRDYLDECKVKYRETHKIEKAKTDKEYREKNKEHFKEKNKEKITCECGDYITKCNMLRHKKSKKHIDLMITRANLL